MQSNTLLGLRGPMVGILTLIVGVGAGCQSYESKPLDLASHAEAWRARTPADKSVRAMARLKGEPQDEADAFNPEDGLSLVEAELVALVYNPTLRMARLRAGVAQATADHAGLWDDPELSIDVLRIAESVPDPWVVGSAISLTIPLSGRLEVEKQRATAAARAQLEQVVESEWRVRQDLRETWARWSATRLRLEETQRLNAALESVVVSTRKLAEAGEMMRTEAALLSIEQLMRRSELTQLRGEAAALEQDLRRLMGLSPMAEASLVVNMPSTALPEGLERQLVQANPALARLRAEYEIAEQTLRREIRKQYPDLVIGPQYESDEGQSRFGFIGAIPIPLLNANRQGIAEAGAERELARTAYQTAYEQAIGEIAALQARLEATRRQRLELEQTLVPMVDQQVDDARRLVELGEIEGSSGVVLLESLVRAHQIKMQWVDLRLAEALYEIAIRRQLGPDHPTDLKAPDMSNPRASDVMPDAPEMNP